MLLAIFGYFALIDNRANFVRTFRQIRKADLLSSAKRTTCSLRPVETRHLPAETFRGTSLEVCRQPGFRNFSTN